MKKLLAALLVLSVAFGFVAYDGSDAVKMSVVDPGTGGGR